MNNTTCNTNRRRTRRHRGAYAPFSNLLNELMNTPLHSVADIKPVRTRPAVNILQSADAYIIEMAVPGVAKENLQVKMDEGKLKISHNKEAATETKYRHREFDYHNFSRTFDLPKDADTGNISAKVVDGVLTVNISKVVKPEPKKIIIS